MVLVKSAFCKYPVSFHPNNISKTGQHHTCIPKINKKKNNKCFNSSFNFHDICITFKLFRYVCIGIYIIIHDISAVWCVYIYWVFYKHFKSILPRCCSIIPQTPGVNLIKLHYTTHVSTDRRLFIQSYVNQTTFTQKQTHEALHWCISGQQTCSHLALQSRICRFFYFCSVRNPVAVKQLSCDGSGFVCPVRSSVILQVINWQTCLKHIFLPAKQN